MGTIILWSSLGAAVAALLGWSIRRGMVPSVIGSAMSDEWMKHTTYQMSKPGSARTTYITTEEAA